MSLKIVVCVDDILNSKQKNGDWKVSKPYISGDFIEFKISKQDNYVATELANAIISFAKNFKYNKQSSDYLFDNYSYDILGDNSDDYIKELLSSDRKGKIPYDLSLETEKEQNISVVYVSQKNLTKEFFQRVIYQIELKNIVDKNKETRFKFAYQNYNGEKNTLNNFYKLLILAYRDYYHLARLPTNIVNPDSLVEMYKYIISVYGLEKNTVFKEQIADKDNLGAIYAVGKASCYKPRLLTVEFGYSETCVNKQFSVCVCGKGVCYDTGGLSLKPTCSMVEMFTDKAGSVLGFLSSVVYYKMYKKPLLYATGIVENAIGSRSYRPGDVIKSYSGKNIHIGNTDAEGRVVLADVLSYVSRNYKLQYILTDATLTGAAKVVCGDDYCPYVIFGENVVYSNADSIENIIDQIKKQTGEYLVKLPNENLFLDSYIQNAGNYGDISNVTKHRCEGSHGPAHFLNYFIESDENNNKPVYIHKDVANYFETLVLSSISSSDLLEFNVLLYNKLNSN